MQPRTLAALALSLLGVACSRGEPEVVEPETSVVVADRGTGFTSERRAEDAAAGVATVASTATDSPSSVEPSPVAPDSSTLVVGGVDASLAARLKADPSAYATTKIENLVTFRMLSLQGIKIDALLDYLFTDVQDMEKQVAESSARVVFDGLAWCMGRRSDETAVAASGRSSYDTGREDEGDSIVARLLDIRRGQKKIAEIKSFTFPAAVSAHDGKDAALVGYMIPLEYKPKTDEIKVFMLVRDLMACCFGGAPRPDEWVYVEMEGEASAKLYPYLPIVVRGTLKVGRLDDEYGLSSGVYSMKARSVEEFRAE